MSKHEYSGEPIDLSWNTPPWQNNGETLDAYNSEGDGKIMTVYWPENATDPDKLNDKQKKMILTAVKYPNVNSPTQLVELSGLDVEPSYAQNVLEPHWPERFWGANNSEPPVNLDVDVDRLRQRLLDGASLNKLAKEYSESQERLSQLVRGEAEDTPDCDTPPLTYLNNSEQKWVVDESKEEDGDTPGMVEVTTEELRRRALDGEYAKEIAKSLGVSASAIRKRLRGKRGFGDESDIPALEFDFSTQEWYIPNYTDEDADTATNVSEPDALKTHHVGVPAWAWVVAVAAVAWFVSKLLGDN